MIPIFPRRTIAWKVEEPAVLRRLTLSAAEIGLLTGVVLRLAHSVVMTSSAASGLTWVVWWYILFALALFGATAAHLGNYPVRHWGWRAPLFALYESVGEVVTSLALIAAHRELWGSARAGFDDWPSIAVFILLWRTLTICSFTLVLAGVVQLVRRILDRRDRQTEAARPSASA
jgi:hypothetical protein